MPTITFGDNALLNSHRVRITPEMADLFGREELNVVNIGWESGNPGAGVFIENIAETDIDVITTAGLNGCMGLQMFGKRLDANQLPLYDAYFCHAPLTSDGDFEALAENNPITKAVWVFHGIWRSSPSETGHSVHGKLSNRSEATLGSFPFTLE